MAGAGYVEDGEDEGGGEDAFEVEGEEGVYGGVSDWVGFRGEHFGGGGLVVCGWTEVFCRAGALLPEHGFDYGVGQGFCGKAGGILKCKAPTELIVTSHREEQF